MSATPSRPTSKLAAALLRANADREHADDVRKLLCDIAREHQQALARVEAQREAAQRALQAAVAERDHATLRAERAEHDEAKALTALARAERRIATARRQRDRARWLQRHAESQLRAALRERRRLPPES